MTDQGFPKATKHKKIILLLQYRMSEITFYRSKLT